MSILKQTCIAQIHDSIKLANSFITERGIAMSKNICLPVFANYYKSFQMLVVFLEQVWLMLKYSRIHSSIAGFFRRTIRKRHAYSCRFNRTCVVDKGNSIIYYTYLFIVVFCIRQAYDKNCNRTNSNTHKQSSNS